MKKLLRLQLLINFCALLPTTMGRSMMAHHSSFESRRVPSISSSHFLSPRDLGRQDTKEKVVFPFPEDWLSYLPTRESFRPDLDFLLNLGFLLMPEYPPASAMLRLSKDIAESEECVQLISCEVSKFANRHRTMNWIHEFMQEMPFKGVIAEKMKVGSEYFKYDNKCGFQCNPLVTMDRGVRTLAMFQDLVVG